MNLVFMLEEPSMKAFLDDFLPRILPDGVFFQTIPHEGKNDLEKSLPRKLSAWRVPETYFIVVRDQDAADCVDVKKKLRDICERGGRPDSLIRIACHELEAWFMGDLVAVGEAFGDPSLGEKREKARYRDPDKLPKPSKDLKELVPGYGKVSGARAMAPLIDIERNRSESFGFFVTGVRRLVGAA